MKFPPVVTLLWVHAVMGTGTGMIHPRLTEMHNSGCGSPQTKLTFYPAVRTSETGTAFQTLKKKHTTENKLKKSESGEKLIPAEGSRGIKESAAEFSGRLVASELRLQASKHYYYLPRGCAPIISPDIHSLSQRQSTIQTSGIGC